MDNKILGLALVVLAKVRKHVPCHVYKSMYTQQWYKTCGRVDKLSYFEHMS